MWEAPGVRDASGFVLEAVPSILLELVDLLRAHRRRPLERLALVGAALRPGGVVAARLREAAGDARDVEDVGGDVVEEAAVVRDEANDPVAGGSGRSGR